MSLLLSRIFSEFLFCRKLKCIFLLCVGFICFPILFAANFTFVVLNIRDFTATHSVCNMLKPFQVITYRILVCTSLVKLKVNVRSICSLPGTNVGFYAIACVSNLNAELFYGEIQQFVFVLPDYYRTCAAIITEKLRMSM